jgi:energy-coupling factor transport system permease protein
MCAMQPVFAAIVWASVLTFVLLAQGVRAFGRALAWQLPIVFVIAVINALFSQNGVTVLFVIGPLASASAWMGFSAGTVYAEAVVYGATMGAVLVSAMQLFVALADAINGDEILAMFGRALPTVALMVSMTLGMVPKLCRRATEVRQVAAANLHQKNAEGKAGAARLVSVLLGWSLEDALRTSDVMSARGWGRRDVKSTRYMRRRFSAIDGIRLAVVCVLLVAAIWAVVSGMLGFAFYPTLPQFELWWGYVPFAVYFYLPHIVFIAEEARWMR